MMLRYRRYRVFVAFAVLTVLLLFHFAGSDSWSASFKVPTSGDQAPIGGSAPEKQPDVLNPPPPGPFAKESKKPDVKVPSAERPKDPAKPPKPSNTERPLQKKPPGQGTGDDTDALEADTAKTIAPPRKGKTEQSKDKSGDGLNKSAGNSGKEKTHPYDENSTLAGINDDQVSLPSEHSEGRKEVTHEPSPTAIHWVKQEEHFPVDELIPLPTARPHPMPRIQAKVFPEESADDKREREAKLMAIKEAFTFTWANYKKYAWTSDELKPVSNGSRNPFAGWRATLVDSLDTLWLMDLKDEFEEAVDAVGEIDFTTSFRKDIPLFETVIRYLGGLVGAYDLSGHKYSVLLQKAVELAEILMGAFDTPNRMPITFYYWMPTYAANPHRAGTRVVLAELGSLSLEFTRLAQLTKEDKYYDAIARITNAFKEWDDTLVPGLWPVHVDASGCKLATQTRPKLAGDGYADSPKKIPANAASSKSKEKAPDPQRFNVKNPVPDDEHEDMVKRLARRQMDDPTSVAKTERIKNKESDELGADGTTSSKAPSKDSSAKKPTQDQAPSSAQASPSAQCIPQGLIPNNAEGPQTFTIGGMADSTYEYLPKEFVLLGGHAPEYRDLYLKSMDSVKENLLFRPNVPEDSSQMLFAGSLTINSARVGRVPVLKTEGAHLTCFAGAMFAYGARLFNRDDDLRIGEELTQGCVWAYNSTTTGIMPEQFIISACESMKGCEWNETQWHLELDPYAEARMETYRRQMAKYKEQVAEAKAKASQAPEATVAPETQTPIPTPTGSKVLTQQKSIDKRAPIDDVEQDVPPSVKKALPASKTTKMTDDEAESKSDIKSKSNSKIDGKGSKSSSKSSSKTTYSDDHEPASYDVEDPDFDEQEVLNDPATAHIWKPTKPISHKEYVAKRIEEERLPKGFLNIEGRQFLLRPEAMESVWYMYRISGDAYWREAGWRMFESIQTHCRAAYGYSAIDDVTKTAPTQKDEMESFWLAETLKYFWLLFEDEDVLSLDQWVLNTEAHAFRRADA
ncbi:glycosyl hydrolase family 47-domain-containing protein [Phyllosticta paracitricarpa]|uniref:alpha-1,2-Mannosidase n=1 Tax=Phyllosticta paracitricarpa TaxID=2016321 RepID=A0ABR1N8H4_9PEZI